MYDVGIIGLGFLGGSLAKSLKNSSKINKIIAVDKNIESLEHAKKDGNIDDYSSYVDDKFSKLDIVFICTPVTYIVDYVKELSNVVKNNCIITDTGSTKKTIIEAIKDIDVDFVGGHPMIGSERSGYETSVKLLFENSYYIITKGEKTSLNAVKVLEEIIKEINALPVIIDENKHDFITASISHVPHVVAASLVNMVKSLDDKNETMKTLAAGGFKDITRIASSDPIMWENITRENKDEINKVLTYLINILEKFKTNIDDTEEIYNFFDSSKKYRDLFINKKINGNTMPELNISIKDENGAIAKIATILSNNDIGIKNIEILNNRENNYGALRVILKTYEERDLAFDILRKNDFDVKFIN